MCCGGMAWDLPPRPGCLDVASQSFQLLVSAEIATLAPGVRKSSMNALQLLLADDLPTLPLYFRPNVTAASNRLVNWKPEYNSNGYTWNVWEWDLR